ncbi:glutamine synthetase/guanido kinase [Basidiobolus meristosporus CBS 931.73]|uniref:Glutamine synthetase n=1 Tax=Basidiobolus meristosporus CBS 931.73 TaxID=1314790 RepID=A0A1Y1Z7U5_9FUNG|nr:glutamine synthetase/guanido kinase [Basidiobolus meristosporus CBS 931.73]|eukprot:ORY06323.1 glutamine synthetase/guanido kinase [Basidiobolus meristosporus CBS 931.73]
MLLNTGEKAGRGIWKPPETKKLIEIRRELDDLFFYTKKRIVDEQWQKVAERLQVAGFHRTMLECKIKWKNLLQKFKETLQPGYNGAPFPFHDDMQWYSARLLREGKDESAESPAKESRGQSSPAAESSHASQITHHSASLHEPHVVNSPHTPHKLLVPHTPQGKSESSHSEVKLQNLHSSYMSRNLPYHEAAGSTDPLPVEPSAFHYPNQHPNSVSPSIHAHQYPPVSSPIPMSKRLKPARYDEFEPLLSSVSYDPLEVQRVNELLKGDERVKVAGIDINGVLREKIMVKTKFLSMLYDGFGFSGSIFGWSEREASSLGPEIGGYSYLVAKVDIGTFRRIPWEENLPFFLVRFFTKEGQPVSVCPRQILGKVVHEYHSMGFEPLCGVKYEWYNYKETPFTLREKNFKTDPLTSDLFNTALEGSHEKKVYFNELFQMLQNFDCPLESLCTEIGPGLYQGALQYGSALAMGDRAQLFKVAVKQISIRHGVMASFMAKPKENMPGCSARMHISLKDIRSAKNIFSRRNEVGMREPPRDGLEDMSQVMNWFVAGLLRGLPSILPILAPYVNSYKRLGENTWTPAVVSWGFENRNSAVRIVSSQADAESTRLEVRISGADMNPHLALGALLGCGMWGIKNKQAIPIPPSVGVIVNDSRAEKFPKSLLEATQKMLEHGSIAREVLGDGFVDHYGSTRLQEWKLWEQSITDWETKRYFEMA